MAFIKKGGYIRMNTGTVYWITGLSGAGKTTVGKLFFEMLARKKKNVLFLDGAGCGAMHDIHVP